MGGGRLGRRRGPSVGRHGARGGAKAALAPRSRLGAGAKSGPRSGFARRSSGVDGVGVDLFEYQARDLFEAHGVPVLRGITARTPDEARAAAALAALRESDEAISYNVSPETCIDAMLFEVREVLYGSSRAH